MDTMIEKFGESRISIIDIDGERWIKASDCAKALDYRNYRVAVSQFIGTNKELLGDCVRQISTQGKGDTQARSQWYFNDRGLIAFLIKTNQPKAIPFQRWAVEVLSNTIKPAIKNQPIDLRSKTKKVRNEFTETLKNHGYSKPGEYIQTTYMIKTRLGIDKHRPKNDLCPWDLCKIAMAEILSMARVEMSGSNGYHECKPVILSASEDIANIPETKIGGLLQQEVAE